MYEQVTAYLGKLKPAHWMQVRGERFSGGLFGDCVADGTIDKWLGRLKEIDDNH